MQTIASSSDSLVRAARQAERQIEMYNQVLQLRIQMQRSFQLVNQSLPPIVPGSDGHFVSIEDVPLVEKDVTSSLGGLLQQLVACSDPSVSPTDVDVADLDELWENISSHQETLYHSKWSPVLDKMLERTLKVTPSLKVFTQSFWTKIDNAMADTVRGRERSLVPMQQSSRCRALVGAEYDEDVYDSLGVWVAPEEDEAEEEDEVQRGARRKRKSDRLYDAESYDDRTLYALLLRSYIDSHAGGANGITGAGVDLAALRRLKRKRVEVDRRASKGRKIRYIVHKKLVQFMFPHPSQTLNTAAFDADKLFKSLFQ